MMREYFENSHFVDMKTNAVLSWILTVYLGVTSLNIFLDGSLTWSLYSLSIVLLVFLPVISSRKLENMVPFEVLVLLAIPFTLKGMALGFVASHTLNYLSASTIALLLIVELDTFTSFKTNYWFSVWLVTVTTIAIAGLWAVARWLSDIYLGTGFIVSENTLMWEFAAASVTGIAAGQLFGFYFKQRDKKVLKDED